MTGFFARILLSLGTLLLVPLALEGAVRAFDYLSWGTWRQDGQPMGLYVTSPGEPPRLKPGVSLNGLQYAIPINPDGFRGPALQHPAPANSYRVWCLGGPTTFDIYAPDDAHT